MLPAGMGAGPRPALLGAELILLAHSPVADPPSSSDQRRAGAALRAGGRAGEGPMTMAELKAQRGGGRRRSCEAGRGPETTAPGLTTGGTATWQTGPRVAPAQDSSSRHGRTVGPVAVKRCLKERRYLGGKR